MVGHGRFSPAEPYASSLQPQGDRRASFMASVPNKWFSGISNPSKIQLWRFSAIKLEKKSIRFSGSHLK
jgi:hypothetical protein